MIKKAVIPAAGFASRLRPLTNDCHKTMLPLGDTTLMRLILERLSENGIEEVCIVTGFKADDLEEHVRAYCGDIKPNFIHNPDFATTNNAYSLYLAEPFAAGEPFILLDSDILFESETLNRVIRSAGTNALALHRRDGLSEEEMKVFSADGVHIQRLSKIGDPKEAIGESIGIEKFASDFSTHLFKTLAERVKAGPGLTEYYEESFQVLIDNGHPVDLVDVSDTKVMEIDFIEDFETARLTILPEISGH